MASFVLVSGAWHAAWCWERVVPLLEARGHRALAPDLLGMGPDRTPLAEVRLARWADQVAEVVRGAGEPVVLVGHSRGGIVISEAAERAPERIRKLVYLAAFLLPDGVSLAAAGGGENLQEGAGYLRVQPDNSCVVPAELVGPTFYNTTPAEWVERAAGLLSPEPLDVFATPLQLSEARFGRVPRAYVECAEDRAVPPALQRAFRARLRCDPVITLPTDHSPFYSAPEQLVQALETIAAG